MRIIARLDVKPPFLIKPIYFEGLKKLGYPEEYIKKYNIEQIDEIMYIDVVSSLYQRPIKFHNVKKSAAHVNIPFTAGGGIKSLEDAEKLISIGADKIIINTHLFDDFDLLSNLSMSLGSQACVAHIQAKKIEKSYECYTDCGRNRTYQDVFDWARKLEDGGIGEIVLSSVDNDGAMNGFNLELAHKLINHVNVPIIVGSGCGTIVDAVNLASLNPSGIAIASAFHFNRFTIQELKSELNKNGIMVNL